MTTQKIRTHAKIALLSLPIFFILASTTLAFQRMGLVGGQSIELSAGGLGELSARCLDEHDAPPLISNSFTKVFNASAPDSVTVEIGNHIMPLQQAINGGLVRISGFKPVSEGGGLYSARIDAVRIENRSGKPITVHVNEGAVLGGSGQSALTYDPKGLLEGQSQQYVWSHQSEVARDQAQLAREQAGNIRQGQENLIALGYLKGRADGSAGPQTQTAIREFQAAHGIGEAGIGTATAARLAAVKKDFEGIKVTNSEPNSGVLRLKLLNDGKPEKPIYTLLGPKGEFYAGDEVSGIVNAISTAIKQRNATSVYVESEGISTDRMNAFKDSLLISIDTNKLQSSLRILPEQKSNSVVEVLFKRGTTIEEITAPEPSVSRPSFFESTIKLRTAALRVYAKTKELVKAFTDIFRSNVSKSPNMSPAAAVDKARKRIKATMPDVKDEDIEVEIVTEVGAIQIWMLQRSRQDELNQ